MRTIWGLIALGVVGCGGSSEVPAEYPPSADLPATSTQAETPPAANATPEAEASVATLPVQVVSAESTPLEGASPTLRIVAPRNGARIARGPVMVTARLVGWSLAPDPGNHVHVIVDNEPYIAVRDVSHPIDIAALVHDNLGHDLAEGTHLVRMFPSRPTHESVKLPGAFASVTFVYGAPTAGFAFDARAPLLTYSRPKGCNVVGTRVLLDFFVTNVPTMEAAGHRVHYTIDGNLSGDIVTWAPHYIENLAAGEHTIQLQLIGPDDAPVPGAYNDTTRTFTVAATCPDPHAAAHAATPAAPENAPEHAAH